MSVKWAMTHDIGADLDLDQCWSRSRSGGTPPLTSLVVKLQNIIICYLENASKLLKIMKYLIKIKKNNFSFSVIHELVWEQWFLHFFRSQQPGKLPVIQGLVREQRFQPVFEAGNQANSLKQCIPTADYPRRKTQFRHDPRGSLWFKCHGSNVMVHCRGSCRGLNH